MSKIKDKLLKMWHNINKEQALKVVASVVKWLTKGKIEKNTVNGVVAIVAGLSNSFGPTAIRPEVEAANEAIRVMQEQVQGTTFLTVTKDTIISGTDTTYVVNLK